MSENVLQTLLEMGFPESKAKQAISSMSNSNLEEAMEWILAHENDPEQIPVEAPTKVNDEDVPEQSEASSSTETVEPVPEAKSVKCEECGLLFADTASVEVHAAKTGHSNFVESTEEKKPLTDEEKKEQLAKIEAKLKQRRLDREAREKQEALDREKNRIRSGKEMSEAKKKQEDMEIKKMIEQRKRDKEDEKRARQRVRDQIEQDKLTRKAKYSGNNSSEVAVSSTVPPKIEPMSTPNVTTQSYSEVRLQIRLTNGTALTQTFGAKEPLSAVRLFVEINRTDEPGGFTFMTNFPKKIFGPDDYDKPLDLLGLTPSAVLIVTKC